MNLEERISTYFDEEDYTWKLTDGSQINPTPSDVRKVLDKAAATLYDGKAGDIIFVAGLAVHKTETGYDVYVMAGSYH